VESREASRKIRGWAYQRYAPCSKVSLNDARNKGGTAVLFVNFLSDNTFEEMTHGNVAIARAV